MSDAAKAIFLSYASQDAEAAKRICDALRSSGVEVWFDAEGGLEHGDEWDAKIRRQIKECVLFIPIISANTEAREEGYFRIEWELAAQRALGIASGVAFILPVVIDDTAEAEALVPDRFRAVQWTRLRGGEVTPEVKQRFLKLWSHRSGVEKQAQRQQVAAEPPATMARDSRRGINGKWFVAIGLVLFAIALYLFLPRPFYTVHDAAAKPVAATASVSEAQQLVAKAWAQLNKPELARAELDVADGVCRRATELEPNNADAWAAWSQVDSWYVYHGLDDTASRRESARTKAAHALQLDPGSYEARLAQACYLVRSPGGHGGTTSLFDEEANGLLATLLREQPAEPRALLAFGILLRNTGHAAEARQTMERLATNPAWAALAWNEIGWAAYLTGDSRAAETAADRSIALQSCWPNLALKMLLSELWTGDLDEGRRVLDKIPPAVRQEDHGVAFACQLFYYRREPQNVLRVLESVSRDWLRSNAFEGPKAYWAGLAHELAGRKESARLQWEAALQQIEQRLARQPEAGGLLWWKGYCLARLGRRDEAGKYFQLARESGANLETVSGVSGRVVGEILLGREDEAVDLLENVESLTTAAWVRLYPGFDPLRKNPRFQALLARLEADPRTSPRAPAAKETVPSDKAPSADAKSVAVLAFANLSEDKSNEYFSDGISEELLNVLAKVPGLKVTARTSSFHFKGKDTPIPEIAQQLGVAYVVEGSVRKAGDKVRITAQLIKASDGFHVWSDTFTRDLKDIFAVQDEIAGLIARNLELKIGVVAAARTVDPEAYRLYLEALPEIAARTQAGFDRAEQLITQAIAKDAGLVPAQAALAVIWTLREQQTGALRDLDSPAARRMVAQAEKAVKLGPDSAEAQAACGLAYSMILRIDEATVFLRRAIELNPSYAPAYLWLGRSYLAMGRMDEALAALRRATELDPLSHRALDNYAMTLVDAGRPHQALEPIDRALRIRPESTQAQLTRAEVLARMGRLAEALPIAKRLAVDQEAGGTMFAIEIFALSGQRAELEALLLATPAISDLDRWYALVVLGRIDEALATLERSQVDWGSIDFLLFNPLADPLRSHPRFRAKMQAAGLTEAHDRAQAWRAANPPEAGGQKTGDRGQETTKPQEAKP